LKKNKRRKGEEKRGEKEKAGEGPSSSFFWSVSDVEQEGKKKKEGEG